MTATLPRPAKPGQRQRKDLCNDYVECPECGVPTWTIRDICTGGYGGLDLEALPAASGYEDGTRCRTHARTVDERAAESARALNIALYRKVGPYLFGIGGWVAIDGTSQGTE